MNNLVVPDWLARHFPKRKPRVSIFALASHITVEQSHAQKKEREKLESCLTDASHGIMMLDQACKALGINADGELRSLAGKVIGARRKAAKRIFVDIETEGF